MPRFTIHHPSLPEQPYRIPLEHSIMLVGRCTDNDIVVSDTSVSMNHCIIKRVKGGFILKDLDSTNGVLLDGVRYNTIDLKDKLKINIGDRILLECHFSVDELNSLSLEDGVAHQQIKTHAAPPAPTKKQLEELYEVTRRLELSSVPVHPKGKEPYIYTILLYISYFLFALAVVIFWMKHHDLLLR